MKSFEIKLALLEYYRYKRNCVCATEFSIFSGVSDVVVYDNKKNLIDIEVKISKSNFKADFKKDKHKIYTKNISYYHKYKYDIPNKFMFCVPIELKDFALKILKDYPKYGLLLIEKYKYRKQDHYKIITEKRAKLLYREPLNKSKIIDSFVMKLSSEVICRTRQLLKYKV